jgi:hypothetical protein
MNAIAACAETALLQHVHAALRLSELLEMVAERVDRTLDAARLRATLEAHPHKFRILDPWQGPWRTALREERGEPHLAIDVWVVVLSDPDDPRPPDEAGALVKLRESVRWLGRGIDPRSRSDVNRWYAIALAERAVRRTVAKRAA